MRLPLHATKDCASLFFTQESVVDGCRRAAHTIEEILVENA